MEEITQKLQCYFQSIKERHDRRYTNEEVRDKAVAKFIETDLSEFYDRIYKTLVMANMINPIGTKEETLYRITLEATIDEGRNDA